MRDYYEVLGVSRGASADEIREAYRKLTRQYHPDRNKSPNAEARFKEINEAHEVLSDPEKRKRYDMFGAGAPGGMGGPGGPDGMGGFPPGFHPFGGQPGGSVNIGDLFEGLFGGGFGPPPGAARRGGGGRATPIHEVDLELSLEDALRGGPRTLQIFPGRGKPYELQVVLPPGVRNGSRFLIRGAGGRKADVAVSVRLRPHPLYRLDGIHLHADLPVTPWDAALGGEVPMPTPDGPVLLTLKPGTPSGRRIKLARKGFCDEGGATRGDLYAEVRIMVPPTLTPEERELFEKLRAVSKFRAETPGM